MRGFVTKTGSKWHRETCRFAKNATEQAISTKAPCAVCKPHLSGAMLTKAAASVGKETLKGCLVCKAACSDPVSREEAPKLGFAVTPTGKCYHTATCRLINRTKSATSTKVTKAKAAAKGKGKANKSAVDKSVMSALGMA